MALTAYETVDFDIVGLSRTRPVRFCTLTWGQTHRQVWTQPGDDPRPDYMNIYPGRRGIGIDVPQNSDTETIVPHDHVFHELVIVQQGEAIHIEPRGEYPIRRGDVLIVAPRAVHGFRQIRGLVKTNIYLQPDWLSEELRLLWGEPGLFRLLLAHSLFPNIPQSGVWHLTLSPSGLQVCEQELSHLHEEAKKTHPSLALFNACFLKILWSLNRCYLDAAPPRSEVLRDEVWYATERIEGLVRQGIPLDAEGLAAEVGLSRSGLARIFKEATGMAPMDYYQERRVQYAARHLTESNASLTEIAYRFGYADSAHFSRMFKRVKKCSPSQYRSQHRPA